MVEFNEDKSTFRNGDTWFETRHAKIYLKKECESCKNLADCLMESDTADRVIFCETENKVPKIRIYQY